MLTLGLLGRGREAVSQSLIERFYMTSRPPYKADLATGRERQLTTGKRAERTKHDFQCSIYRSVIGQAWPTQLFDLRAPLSADVPVLLLNQPIESQNNRRTAILVYQSDPVGDEPDFLLFQ